MTDAPVDCLQCGACCATFRVDFVQEELVSQGGKTPDSLAQTIGHGICRMNGTDHSSPRCTALQGEIGKRVHCAIYEFRPSVCDAFARDSHACLRARQKKGLISLAP
jgi:Fe-S-cluster containining protein